MEIGTGIAVTGVAISIMGIVFAALWRQSPGDTDMSARSAELESELGDERRANIWTAIESIKTLIEKQDQRIRIMEDILIKMSSDRSKG